MAEFQTVMKERERMCNCFDACVHCPLRKVQEKSVLCRDWTFSNPAEAEQIIIKWAAENPPKTNGDKFREVFGYDMTEKFFTSSKVKDWYNAEYKKPEEQEEEQEELT